MDHEASAQALIAAVQRLDEARRIDDSVQGTTTMSVWDLFRRTLEQPNTIHGRRAISIIVEYARLTSGDDEVDWPHTDPDFAERCLALIDARLASLSDALVVLSKSGVRLV